MYLLKFRMSCMFPNRALMSWSPRGWPSISWNGNLYPLNSKSRGLDIYRRQSWEIIRLVASVHPSVHLFTLSCLNRAFNTVCMLRSGWYMGLAYRVLRKITMTHGIQSKISVCLSVIRKCSRSRDVRSSRGLLNFFPYMIDIIQKIYVRFRMQGYGMMSFAQEICVWFLIQHNITPRNFQNYITKNVLIGQQKSSIQSEWWVGDGASSIWNDKHRNPHIPKIIQMIGVQITSMWMFEL